MPTFAEAYKQQKESRTSLIPEISTEHAEKEVRTVIRDLVQSLGERSKDSPLKHAKRLVKFEHRHYKEAIRKWTDVNKLDLIHHAILTYNPAVLEVILKAELYPEDHSPAITPYAHLAAFVGATSCLKFILTYRPGDFFKSTKKEHMLKISDEQRSRIKPAHSNYQTLMDRIKAISSQEDDHGNVSFFQVTDYEINDLIEEIQQLEQETSNDRKKKDSLTTIKRNLKSSLPNIAIKPKSTSRLLDKTGKPALQLPQIHRSDSSMKASFNRSQPTPLHKKASPTHSVPESSQEWGIRNPTKFKDFFLHNKERKTTIVSTMVEDSKPNDFIHKTPLTLAAEQGNIESIRLILKLVIMKQCKVTEFKEPLSMCTKTNNPEAIVVLIDHKYAMEDLQFATLTAIRDLRPECLTALMSAPEKSRKKLLDGTNLFHLLYSQSVGNGLGYSYDLLPVMTRILITNNEDVNDSTVLCSFPMYTLISCAFKICSREMLYYQQCLELLLEAKANPHFSEEENAQKDKKSKGKKFAREKYHSAFNCIFACVRDARTTTDNRDLVKLFMKTFILRIIRKDLTPRRIHAKLLFDYMDIVSDFGLDASILRCLLRYGANPDHMLFGKYAVNIYFDRIIEHLKDFEHCCNCTAHYTREVEILMSLCDAMSHLCLKEAIRIFLDEHMLTTPLQALPATRYFCYLADQLTRSPRSLRDITGQHIWVKICQRNDKLVKLLPVNTNIQWLILP